MSPTAGQESHTQLEDLAEEDTPELVQVICSHGNPTLKRKVNKTMKFFYARSSSLAQEEGLRAQVELAEQLGCEKVFAEKISGTKRARPELNKMLEMVREDDVLYVKNVSRLARSMVDFCNILKALEQKKVRVVFVEQNFDTNDPSGKLLLNVMASFSEFQASIIKNSCSEGRERYLKRGGKLGAKRKTSRAKDEAILAAYNQGASYKELQETFGLSKMSVWRRLKGKAA